MIHFVISLIFGLCFFGIDSKLSEGHLILSVLSAITFVISLIAFVCCFYWEYDEQIKDIEKIKEYTGRKKLFEESTKSIIDEFKSTLVIKYPEIEKDLFKNFIPNNISAIAVSIPEIKSSETLLAYCHKINEIQNKIIEQDEYILRFKRDISYRKRNIIYFGLFLPVE